MYVSVYYAVLLSVDKLGECRLYTLQSSKYVKVKTFFEPHGPAQRGSITVLVVRHFI